MKAYNKFTSIVKQRNYLCIGLDSDISKMPDYFEKNLNGLLDFNTFVIENTKDYCASYKINFAFYEQYGTKGMEVLEKTLDLIPNEIFTIADAKRGDIGNTSKSYAKAVFEELNFDSITVSPYMGRDSVEPFLEYNDKIVIVLCLTSNPGSADFQRLIVDGKELYKHVLDKTMSWADHTKVGFVVGATHPSELEEIRNIANENLLLIPGVGAQGGDIEAILQANQNKAALINVSRAILYPKITSTYFEALMEQTKYYSKILK